MSISDKYSRCLISNYAGRLGEKQLITHTTLTKLDKLPIIAIRYISITHIMSSSEYRPQSLLGTTPYDALMAEAARRKRPYSDHPLAVELGKDLASLRARYRNNCLHGVLNAHSPLGFLLTCESSIFQSCILSLDVQYLELLQPIVRAFIAAQR